MKIRNRLNYARTRLCVCRCKRQIRRAAKRIDPKAAEMVWWYTPTVDPYEIYGDLPVELQQMGRAYFLADPKRKWAVLIDEVRTLHPDIPDDEWDELMKAARARDKSPDPLSMFHLYGTAEAPKSERPNPDLARLLRSIQGEAERTYEAESTGSADNNALAGTNRRTPNE